MSSFFSASNGDEREIERQTPSFHIQGNYFQLRKHEMRIFSCKKCNQLKVVVCN